MGHVSTIMDPMADTDISPVFGLTLVGTVEFVGIAAALGSFVVALVIWRGNRKNHEIQINTASANLTLKLRKSWSRIEDPEFAKFVRLLHEETEKVDVGNQMIGRFLNALEKVAIFRDGEAMIDLHVKEFFGRDLQAIHKEENKAVYDQLVKDRKDGAYAHLWDLVHIAKKWKV